MKTIHFRQAIVPIASAVALLAAASASVAQSTDYKWPRLLVIGTPGTGSGSFASTNGWAPVLQKEMGATVRIVPEDNEPQRYLRLVDRKDIKISSVSAAEMRFQVQGIGGYATTPAAAQRILWHHNDSPWGFVTSGDSKLKSIEDIKKGGVRVTQGMFSPPMQAAVNGALPAFLGLSEAQAQQTIKYVPASSYSENCRSVVEGKSDVAYCSPISSVLSEMEGSPGGIRWLALPLDNKAGWAGYLKHRPMLVPSEITLGVSTARGVAGATSNFVYAVPADTEVDFAYNLAKWLHKSHDAYKATHPLAARMSLEQFRKYLDRTPLPVHEGTVKYLREVGAWTDKDDVWNKEATDKMDQWVKARSAALTKARANGTKLDFQDEAFLSILNQETKGLEGFKTRL
jgi:hypothetical protein